MSNSSCSVVTLDIFTFCGGYARVIAPSTTVAVMVVTVALIVIKLYSNTTSCNNICSWRCAITAVGVAVAVVVAILVIVLVKYYMKQCLNQQLLYKHPEWFFAVTPCVMCL